MSTNTAHRTITQASALFYLRDCNLSEAEDQKLLSCIAPWSYSNLPVPVKTERTKMKRYGKFEAADHAHYIEISEHFSDGSVLRHAAETCI